MTNHAPLSVLVADDDPDDRLLIKEALQEARLANTVDFVDDGEELMDFLFRRGEFAHLAGSSLPGLLLLDLNMPRKDGREALEEIKGDPKLRRLPIVVLTTSKAEDDVLRTYDLGANSFVVKPVRFDDLVETVNAITHYWSQIVELPSREGGAGTP